MTSEGDLVATGLAFGLTITLMVYAFGRISGGHFNPAVSVGAALGGRIAWKDAGLYAAAQVVGAIVGALVLMILALGIVASVAGHVRLRREYGKAAVARSAERYIRAVSGNGAADPEPRDHRIQSEDRSVLVAGVLEHGAGSVAL